MTGFATRRDAGPSELNADPRPEPSEPNPSDAEAPRPTPIEPTTNRDLTTGVRAHVPPKAGTRCLTTGIHPPDKRHPSPVGDVSRGARAPVHYVMARTVTSRLEP